MVAGSSGQIFIVWDHWDQFEFRSLGPTALRHGDEDRKPPPHRLLNVFSPPPRRLLTASSPPPHRLLTPSSSL